LKGENQQRLLVSCSSSDDRLGRRMSLRFRRSVRIAPGVRLNLGLHGAGLSVGPRGLHVGVNRRGMYSSAGIPGTGLYATHHYRAPGQDHPEVRGSGCGAVLLIVATVALTVLVLERC
jgi:hypothetical protein